jgi:hypothetical protein
MLWDIIERRIGEERLQHMGMGLFRRISGNGFFGLAGYTGIGLDNSGIGL